MSAISPLGVKVDVELSPNDRVWAEATAFCQWYALVMKPGPIAPSSREKANSHTLRAARTRQRIVDAVRSFVDEGNAQPTAKQIAQRAGVCLRTVFNSGPTELRIEALTDDHIKRFADQLRRMTDRDLVMALLSGELPKGLNGSNSPAAEPDKEELRR